MSSFKNSFGTMFGGGMGCVMVCALIGGAFLLAAGTVLVYLARQTNGG